MPKMTGGYGSIPWNSFNGLSINEAFAWLKICETAFKTTDDEGMVYVTKRWMERNCKDDDEAQVVLDAIMSLENLGYVKCTIRENRIDVKIRYEIVDAVCGIVGKDRRFGVALADVYRKTSTTKHGKRRKRWENGTLADMSGRLISRAKKIVVELKAKNS